MDASLDTLQPREKLGVGPTVAIVLLVLLFAAGGVYLFLEQKERLTTPPVVEVINT